MVGCVAPMPCCTSLVVRHRMLVHRDTPLHILHAHSNALLLPAARCCRVYTEADGSQRLLAFGAGMSGNDGLVTFWEFDEQGRWAAAAGPADTPPEPPEMHGRNSAAADAPRVAAMRSQPAGTLQPSVVQQRNC